MPSGRLGWKRQLRLAHGYEFEKVKRHGRCLSLGSFVLCYSANGLTYPRFGFVVSRRLGKAAVRNRVRRWLREAVRNLLPSISRGWDIVLIARKPTVDAGYEALRRAIWEALGEAGLLVPQRAPAESVAAADKDISDRRIAPFPGGV